MFSKEFFQAYYLQGSGGNSEIVLSGMFDRYKSYFHRILMSIVDKILNAVMSLLELESEARIYLKQHLHRFKY